MSSDPRIGYSTFLENSDKDDLVNSIADIGYGIFPDMLSLEIQRNLITLMDEKLASDELVRAGVGAGQETRVRSEIRSDSIIWLDPDRSSAEPVVRTWLHGMNDLAEHFRREIFLPVFDYEGHLAHYPGGGFYKAHLDRHHQTLARQISIITYLNDDWQESDGGQLRIYTDRELGVNDPYIDVIPKSGTIVIFLSGDFWHEVLPSKRPRLSLTGWLRGRS